jgi:hypothetical protein
MRLCAGLEPQLAVPGEQAAQEQARVRRRLARGVHPPDRDGVGQASAMRQQVAGGDPPCPPWRPRLAQLRDVPDDRCVQIEYSDPEYVTGQSKFPLHAGWPGVLRPVQAAGPGRERGGAVPRWSVVSAEAD